MYLNMPEISLLYSDFKMKLKYMCHREEFTRVELIRNSLALGDIIAE